MIYLALFPSIVLFLAVVVKENNSLRNLQFLALFGAIMLFGFDLWYSGGDNAFKIALPLLVTEIFHFVLLGSGLKIPFLTHEFILLGIGLMPWFLGIHASFIFAVVSIIGLVLTLAIASQLLLPTIPSSTTNKD